MPRFRIGLSLLALPVLLTATPGQEPKAAPRVPPEVIRELGFDPYDQSKVPLEQEPPADFTGKKIVLVAGSKSHGPGDHEFFAGTAILMNLLKQNGVWPVMARDGWPKNEKIFDGAASLVFYMDGGGGHPVARPERLKLLQKYVDAGVGWANFHYAVEYTPRPGETVSGWMGGYYDPRISTNPHWDATIRSLPQHPITRGVKPFTLNDEWYFNMRWLGDAPDAQRVKGLTPILQAVPPEMVRRTPEVKKYPGRLETLAWAYERPDGGRGFGFTGGHRHRNWGDENFRRVVVNAILWTAKVEIPEGGAKVAFDPIDLNRNLDYKGQPFRKITPPTP